MNTCFDFKDFDYGDASSYLMSLELWIFRSFILEGYGFEHHFSYIRMT